MIKKIALSTLLASTLVVVANADDKKANAFVTHTELGYIETSGNTETKTFNLDANVKKNFDKHIFALSIDGQYASDNNSETKNKYALELNYDYEFTSKFAFNYVVGYKSDKFSSFDYQFYTGPGAKYKALKTTTQNLSLEGSILYSQDKIKSVTNQGYTDNYSSYRAKGVYSWQMLPNLKFGQELSYRGSFEDSENYFINSKSALTSKLSDILSAGLSYKVDYVNQAGNKENTDTTLTANIIIDY